MTRSSRQSFRQGLVRQVVRSPAPGAEPALEKGSGRDVPTCAGGRVSSNQHRVAASAPYGEFEELLTQPSVPWSIAEYQHLLLPTANFLESLHQAFGRMGSPGNGGQVVGGRPERKVSRRLSTPLQPTQTHRLICHRRNSYHLFGRLLLGFSKQPHGELKSSCPFRLSVPCARQVTGSRLGGAGGKDGNLDARRRARRQHVWCARATRMRIIGWWLGGVLAGKGDVIAQIVGGDVRFSSE